MNKTAYSSMLAGAAAAALIAFAPPVEKPAPQNRPGYVYVMSNPSYSHRGELFKVGMTKDPDPEFRMKSLNVAGVPAPFELNAYVPVDDISMESKVHKLLEQYRLPKKEWFIVDSLLVISNAFHAVGMTNVAFTFPSDSPWPPVEDNPVIWNTYTNQAVDVEVREAVLAP